MDINSCEVVLLWISTLLMMGEVEVVKNTSSHAVM